MEKSKIQKHLKNYGSYNFNLNYNSKKYNITIVMFSKDKKIIFFEAIESIKEIILENNVEKYLNVKIDVNIITNNFLKKITEETGCFQTKNQHRPPRKVIKEWLITDINNKNKNNDVICICENRVLKLEKINREKIFTSKNRFNLFFNNAYFYFEDGFFKIMEEYFDIIKTQSELRHYKIDEIYLFLVYSLSDFSIKEYLKKVLEATDKYLSNNNLTLKEIYRVDYIKYKDDLNMLAKNFLYHTIKLDVENIKIRPISTKNNILPLTKNLSIYLELKSEKFLLIPFTPREGVLIAFGNETLLNQNVDLSFSLNGMDEILTQIVLSKDFLDDEKEKKRIVIPSDIDYLSFAENYIKNLIFNFNEDHEVFIVNKFRKKLIKIENHGFTIYPIKNENDDPQILMSKKNIYLNSIIQINLIKKNKKTLTTITTAKIDGSTPDRMDFFRELIFINGCKEFNFFKFYFIIRYKDSIFEYHFS